MCHTKQYTVCKAHCPTKQLTDQMLLPPLLPPPAAHADRWCHGAACFAAVRLFARTRQIRHEIAESRAKTKRQRLGQTRGAADLLHQVTKRADPSARKQFHALLHPLGIAFGIFCNSNHRLHDLEQRNRLRKRRAARRRRRRRTGSLSRFLVVVASSDPIPSVAPAAAKGMEFANAEAARPRS